ncbi:MAG TPA: CapA family protein [Candidatus Limnocylindrales bacterium]|nr:CapA family protein [Candidatus Limnocylindrales bacterium]
MRPLLAALGVMTAVLAVTVLAVLAVSPPYGAASGSDTSPSVAAPASAPSSSTATAGSGPSSSSMPGETTATPADSPAAMPSAGVVEIAVVPVTDFRATQTSTNLREVQSVLAGSSRRYQSLELVSDEADAILAELGLARPPSGDHLVLAPTARALAGDLAESPKRLGFLRADAIGPSVRALAWGADSLFGVGRVEDLADWPLVAAFRAGTGPDSFDATATWTLFAGGDILLDRGVYKTLVVEGKGQDFPFDGGTADITSRYCCSSFGWELPRASRTGHAGAFRDLIGGADLAIANFENPAPDGFRWHTKGTVFSADPALIEGLADAGIDYVSLANNHIRDAGGQGILETIANIRREGIAVSGAGRNLAAARKPAMLEAGGQTVAVLAYDAIAGYYHATADKIGSAPLTASVVRTDVKAARAAGADLVIVFPHWGTEYRSKPSAAQQNLARMIIDSGADMVIGNHAHWAAAMEVYKGKPIWYALGNFVFDQTWSEPTMEGITLELTFSGADLVQARMRPHIILDRSQPNFLDPAGDGKVVLGQVYSASKGLLPW